ncbi:hypothetical protein ES705_18079 [subsurface metagenome]|jgi:hypothetical protein|nr:MAG: hypothetical protein CEE42_11380 [Candidatus Lokiarchaeota archaeon Loki_b31]
MEIEKTRETSWKIQLKNKNESIELTSVEISGEVRTIKLTLLKNNESIIVEMAKEEFFNFLSLITAFKDVVIGEDQIILTESLISSEIEPQKQVVEENNDYLKLPAKPTEENIGNNESEELNPEEWDPW